MEDVYYTVALVSFALAICSFVACVIIFFRAGVPDAIRFLQHRPVKKPAGGRRSSALRAGSGRKRQNGGESAKQQAHLERDEATYDLFDKTTKDADQLVSPGGSESETDVLSEESENPTGLLAEESENPTGLLDNGASEQPTGLLAGEESENPTGLLEAEASESPTGLLGEESSEMPTGLLADEASESPTSLLGDDSERPTSLLVQDAEVDRPDESAQTNLDERPSGIAQQEETTFRFILKQNVVVVHTQEVIE